MNQEEHDALTDMTETEARAWLEERYGEVWNTDEAMKLFKFSSFMSPYALVKRKKDGKEGTVKFTHNPRFYFSFKE